MTQLTSVIIPAHNEEKYIEPTIESYRRQTTQRPFEIIVVANGCDSNDDTANKAHDLGAKVIELEEGNVSTARNIGAAYSQGDLFVFNDADTRVALNYVDAVTNAHEQGFEFGCTLFKPENYHPISLLYSAMTWGSGLVFRDAGGNMFVDRELFEEVEGFDSAILKGQDTDLSRRMKEAGARFKFLHDTHIITSLRKFEENGYLTELFGNQIWPYVKAMLTGERS